MKKFQGKKVIKALELTKFMVECMTIILNKQEQLSTADAWNKLTTHFALFNVHAAAYSAYAARTSYREFCTALVTHYSTMFTSVITESFIFDFEIELLRRRTPSGDKRNPKGFKAFMSHRNTEGADAMSGSWGVSEINAPGLEEILANEDKDFKLLTNLNDVPRMSQH